MDILVALVFAGLPVAWVLHKFASATLAAVPYRLGVRRARPPVDSMIRLEGGGTYEFAIVGTSRYRSALGKIHGAGSNDHGGRHVEAILLLESASQAVRVEIEGYTVGHLAPDLASEYRRRLAEKGYLNAKGACKARVSARHGAVDRVEYSVRLDLPARRA